MNIRELEEINKKVDAKERGYCLLRDINGGYILIGEIGIEKCE